MISAYVRLGAECSFIFLMLSYAEFIWHAFSTNIQPRYSLSRLHVYDCSLSFGMFNCDPVRETHPFYNWFTLITADLWHPWPVFCGTFLAHQRCFLNPLKFAYRIQNLSTNFQICIFSKKIAILQITDQCPHPPSAIKGLFYYWRHFSTYATL